MLVLTRRLGEALVIGEGIIVEIVAINARQVRLGIKAPQEVTILRDELMDEEQLSAIRRMP